MKGVVINMKKTIMGIQLGDREEEALEVQRLLTEYGCYIKTRIGVHDVESKSETSSPIGIIILDLILGKDEKIKELKEKLDKINGVVVKIMEFNL